MAHRSRFGSRNATEKMTSMPVWTGRAAIALTAEDCVFIDSIHELLRVSRDACRKVALFSCVWQQKHPFYEVFCYVRVGMLLTRSWAAWAGASGQKFSWRLQANAAPGATLGADFWHQPGQPVFEIIRACLTTNFFLTIHPSPARPLARQPCRRCGPQPGS